MNALRTWLERLFCKHDWFRVIYSLDDLTVQEWDECKKCNKVRQL